MLIGTVATIVLGSAYKPTGPIDPEIVVRGFVSDAARTLTDLEFDRCVNAALKQWGVDAAETMNPIYPLGMAGILVGLQAWQTRTVLKVAMEQQEATRKTESTS